MNDQPKPMTGKRKSCDCDDPSVPHYPEDHLITPKPIGEQAVAMTRVCLWRLREEVRSIEDAHGNDAVPAYLRRCVHHLSIFENSEMSDQPKPIGEWTVEPFTETFPSTDFEGRPFLIPHTYKVVCGSKTICTTPFKEAAEGIADAHNAALDEAVDAAEQEILLLRQQLDGERENSRPIPISGGWIAAQSENPKYPEEWDVKEGGKNGYSVIGTGFITQEQAKEIAFRHSLVEQQLAAARRERDCANDDYHALQQQHDKLEKIAQAWEDDAKRYAINSDHYRKQLAVERQKVQTYEGALAKVWK